MSKFDILRDITSIESNIKNTIKSTNWRKTIINKTEKLYNEKIIAEEMYTNTLEEKENLRIQSNKVINIYKNKYIEMKNKYNELNQQYEVINHNNMIRNDEIMNIITRLKKSDHTQCIPNSIFHDLMALTNNSNDLTSNSIKDSFKTPSKSTNDESIDQQLTTLTIENYRLRRLLKNVNDNDIQIIKEDFISPITFRKSSKSPNYINEDNHLVDINNQSMLVNNIDCKLIDKLNNSLDNKFDNTTIDDNTIDHEDTDTSIDFDINEIEKIKSTLSNELIEIKQLDINKTIEYHDISNKLTYKQLINRYTNIQNQLNNEINKSNEYKYNFNIIQLKYQSLVQCYDCLESKYNQLADKFNQLIHYEYNIFTSKCLDLLYYNHVRSYKVEY